MDNFLKDEITKWVVNDYFTPNIKAEVILDTLLTPCIADIVKDQCKSKIEGDLQLVTKEMSIMESDPDPEKTKRYGNRGTKIDYILTNKKYVYLVELKTISSSIRKKQVERYITNCAEKTFGQALGNKLVKIMKLEPVDISTEYILGDLREVFKNRFDNKDECIPPFAEQAKELLKKKKLYSTNKYLYTIGQILDYVDGNDGENEIWDREVKLIYITPYGDDILSNGAEISKWEKLYVSADRTTSVSLRDSLSTLNGLKDKKKNREYVELLINIIEELYPEKEEND